MYIVCMLFSFIFFVNIDLFFILLKLYFTRPITAVGIQWYKKENPGQPLLSDGVKYIISESGRRLTFKSVSSTDSGEYQCEASLINAGNVEKITASANLTVLCKSIGTVSSPCFTFNTFVCL